MMSLLIANEEYKMFFRLRRRKTKSDEKQEAEIQAIKKDTLKSVDEAAKSTKKAADVILEQPDITLQIFYATKK